MFPFDVVIMEYMQTWLAVRRASSSFGTGPFIRIIQSWFNSLAPGWFGLDFKNTISSVVLLIGIYRSSDDNARA